MFQKLIVVFLSDEYWNIYKLTLALVLKMEATIKTSITSSGNTYTS